MPNARHPAKHQLRIYGPAALIVVGAFALAFQFIKPAPPGQVVMATGDVDGAYHAFAQRYAAHLAREGIRLVLRPTAGSVENLRLLRAGDASIALVQGGVEQQDDTSGPGAALRSLGSVFYEPLWLFHRADREVRDLRDLKGVRTAVGERGSGTRALVGRLMQDNGLVEDENWVAVGGQSAVDSLLAGKLDAVFLVISAQSPLIERLLRSTNVVPADFGRTEAYTRRYRVLSSLKLPEGALDLADNIPNRDLRLLAPAANLIARSDIHPAINDLLLQAATTVHRPGGWFEAQDEFPQPVLLAYPLSDEAERFYEQGPPFLQRYMPFWAASLVDRLKVMLLPLLVLLIPLIKVMPPIYTWRMRARVYRWYDELEKSEADLVAGKRDAASVRAELARIEGEVQRVKVPLSFTDQLYNLRQHIELVRGQLDSTGRG